MNTRTNKTPENKSNSAGNGLSSKQSVSEFSSPFADNRPETVAQKKLQEMANNSSRVKQEQGFSDNLPVSNNAAVLQRMTINGGGLVNSTVSGPTTAKHVVADAAQAAAAQANYGDSTFVRNGALLSAAIDADNNDFALLPAQSPTFNINTNIVIDLWEKTQPAPGGLAAGQPAARTITNTATPCDVGARKFGDGTIKVVHFKKNP